MVRRTIRTLALAAFAAPLSLALAGCGESKTGSDALSGEPIAKVAPPQGQHWTDVIAKTDAGGYVMGNPDAPIKLVEYGSLTCPHCAHFADESNEALRETFVESGRVSYEYRNFVMNPLDLAMAMLVRCGAPESFFALVEQTYVNQQQLVETWTNAGEQKAQQAANMPPDQRYFAIASLAGLPEFYGARGIAVDQAKQCLADGNLAEQLVKNTSTQADQFQITGTPSFLINGRKIEGNTWPEVKTALETAGAR